VSQLKEAALKELEAYMSEFDTITAGALTEADLDDFWEDFSTEAVEDSKAEKKEEVKKRDPYYTHGPKMIKQPLKDPYYG